MIRPTIVAASLALATALAGCQKQAEAPAPVPNSSMMSGSMDNMPTAGAMKHGQATGTVTAIDAAKGTITLDHGPMRGLDWPAMTMAFTTKPEQLTGLKVGDKVVFEIDWDGKIGTITKIKII
jgi:Cu/Ag efflux protein CusF